MGVIVSIGAAYLVMQFLSIMDYVQGNRHLGMLWKRATPAGGFWGLPAGTLSSIAMWAWVKVDPSALAIIALSPRAKDKAENMYRGLWSWLVCVLVTVLVSKPMDEKRLAGLVYGCTDLPSEGQYHLYQRPIFWAGVVAVVFAILNLMATGLYELQSPPPVVLAELHTPIWWGILLLAVGLVYVYFFNPKRNP